MACRRAYRRGMADDMAWFYALPKEDQERLLRDPRARLSDVAAKQVRDTPAEGITWCFVTDPESGQTHLSADAQTAVRALRDRRES